ncbi:MAG: GGDEF domain-containing protein [Spirochaetales bacterium]|nr:GGDEF domain-containing protein [Spirochaetales bacterium]
MAICTLTTYIFLQVQRINRDYLTGVYNRQQFEDMVYARVAKWGTAGPFSLVLLDLNDFKFINDTHGHDAGDEALKTIARILIHSVQASDTVARTYDELFKLADKRMYDYKRKLKENREG